MDSLSNATRFLSLCSRHLLTFLTSRYYITALVDLFRGLEYRVWKIDLLKRNLVVQTANAASSNNPFWRRLEIKESTVL